MSAKPIHMHQNIHILVTVCSRNQVQIVESTIVASKSRINTTLHVQYIELIITKADKTGIFVYKLM
jgi:hypothetical protein